MKQSDKPIRPPGELLGTKLFFIPTEKGNERNPETGELSVYVSINGHPHYVPVNKETTMDYDVFCVMRDAGIFGPNATYVSYDDFDPMRI